MRTYTVRAARVEGPDPQIDIDFVLHGAEWVTPVPARAGRPRRRWSSG